MMIRNQSPKNIVDQDTINIRAFSSITSEQADTLVRIIRDADLAWDIQTFDNYDGYLSLLIMPIAQDNEHKSFSVTGTVSCLELGEAHNDTLVSLGSFNNVNQLSIELTKLISPVIPYAAGS